MLIVGLFCFALCYGGWLVGWLLVCLLASFVKEKIGGRKSELYSTPSTRTVAVGGK